MTPIHHCHPQTLFRVLDPHQGRATMARRDGDAIVAVDGAIEQLHQRRVADATWPSGQRIADADADLKLLAPIPTPSKIVCVGLNYLHHAREMDKTVPEQPLLFMKPPSALIGYGDAIELPSQSRLVHHEGELAIVIGQRLKDANETEASEAIFGFSCACDVTARDIQRAENRYTRAKGFDTFAPVGPAIAPADRFHPADHRLTCSVNGELRQQSQLDDFIFPIPRVLAFISEVMTLNPGDLVLTGTPAGVGPIVDGDTVRVDIDGIGTLENPVRPR